MQSPDTTTKPERPMGSNRVPDVGDTVYLPSRPGPDLFHGGSTTVLEVIRKPRARIRTEVDPDQWIEWFTVANEQAMLHFKLSGTSARKATEAEIQAFHAETAAKKAAAEEAERKRWLPKAFAALNGGLLEVPVWEDHPRAKNWAAIVEVDGTAPGGLSRTFFNRGNGPVFYILPAQLQVGVVLEFGADYIRYSGRRDPARWYGILREITKDSLVIQPFKDAKTALLEAQKS